MNLDSNDNVCRICLKRQETLFSLFRNLHGVSPYQKLVSKTNLRIELNDAGPSSICSQCLIDLDTTVSFLERCEQSNLALTSKVEQLQHKHDVPCSNTKNACLTKFEDETWIEIEPITRDEPPLVPTSPHAIKNSNEVVKASRVLIEEHKCPTCGSSRRCMHWSPPSTYPCEYCDRIFNKKYNLQIHLKRHLGERDFMCPACGAPQLTASLAARHCRPKPRRHCPTPGCGKTFTTNSNLHIHMRSHTGERPFECHNCGKGFTSKKTLKDHVRIHTGEKPYMCPVCGARFTSNHIAAHMLSHAARAPPAPGAGAGAGGARHACPRGGCSRRFPSAAALRSHARAHGAGREFLCALCTCSYKYKQSLNKHVRARHAPAPAPAPAPLRSPPATALRKTSDRDSDLNINGTTILHKTIQNLNSSEAASTESEIREKILFHLNVKK